MRALLLTALAVVGPAGALAADRGDPAPFDWSGYYIGGQLGYSWGDADWRVRGPGTSLEGSFDFFRPFDAFKGTGSYFGGLQAGYNYRLPSGVVIGLEADLAAPNTIMDARAVSSPANGQATISDTVEMSGTARGRLGFVYGDWLLYGTVGYAWSYELLLRTQLFGTPLGGTAVPGTVEKANAWRNGLALGAGVEIPVASKWTASMEYLFTAFGAETTTFPAAAQRFDSELTIQSLRVGLNYHFGDDPKDASQTPLLADSERWSVHAQTTFVQQYAFPFRAPYRGPNSLDPNAGRETWDATLFVGVRLWPGAELWVNPEIDQGFGLSTTLGVAGFPSAEAYKVGANYPYTRLPRTFIRQTINLGGESEKVEAGANRFAGSETSDRIVLTLGKFSVTDVFDNNKYAHDSRGDFLNWALVDTGTFDYAADAWGYTYGAAAEWYRGHWAFRAGLFDLSIVPNSTDLDPTFKQFQWMGEIERRYSLWGQPGKVAVTGFLTYGRMGSFEDALELASLTGQPPDTSLVRRYQIRTGVSFNMEQQLSKDVGIFARAGVADGTREPFAFTDVDRTVAAGLVVTGRSWGRPDDTFGSGAIINGLTSEHLAYFNAGGLGILVGDGKLPHYSPEKILEMYYAFPLFGGRATIDYEFVWDPAYNEDRGPVSVIATRLRYQF